MKKKSTNRPKPTNKKGDSVSIEESQAPAPAMAQVIPFKGPAAPEAVSNPFAAYDLARLAEELQVWGKKIADLEALLKEAQEGAYALYREYQSRMEAITLSMSLPTPDAFQPAPPDRRKAFNLVRNLKLTVDQAFRHAKERGMSEDDARKHVLSRVEEIAKSRYHVEVLPDEVAQEVANKDYGKVRSRKKESVDEGQVAVG